MKTFLFRSNILATSTFRQSVITFIGTFGNAVLGAIFYIICARFLEPTQFGLLMVAIVTLSLVADVGNLGTDTGLVRFVGKYLAKSPEKAKRFIKVGLKVKIAVGLIISFVGFFLASFIAKSLFSKPELSLSLKIAFFGVISTLLFYFTLAIFQSLQKFWQWSGIQIFTNFLRLSLIIILILLGRLQVETTILAYIVSPLIGFLVGLFFIPRDLLKVKNEFSVASEFFHYNKWVAAFTLVAAVASRVDTFLVARLLPLAQVGIYSAATQLVQIFPQVAGAIGTVIAPRMARIIKVDEFISYLKKTQVMVLFLALLGLFAIPVVLFLIPILYGSAYFEVGPIFVILLLAVLIFLIAVPIHISVFYYFAKPSFFFFLSLGQLIIVSSLGWILIPIYGAYGAASAVLIGHIFNFLVPAFWVVRKISTKP